MMVARILLETAADVGAEVKSAGGDNVLTGILALTSTIFGALTLTQRGRVDDLNKVLAKCESQREADLNVERARSATCDAKEDKLLERVGTMAGAVTDLANAVKENATISTAVVQEVRANAQVMGTIARNSDSMARDLADSKRELAESRRALDELRIRRAGGSTKSE